MVPRLLPLSPGRSEASARTDPHHDTVGKAPTPFRLLVDAATADRRGRLLALGTAGLVIHQIAETLVPLTIGVIIDEAIIPGDLAALVFWLAALALIFIVLTLAWRMGARSNMRVFSWGAHDLRQRTVRRILDSRGMASPRAPGEVLILASSDTSRVAGIAWVIGEQLAALAAVLTAAISLLLISVPLGVAVLVATPVVLAVMHLLSLPLEARSEREQSAAANAGAIATDFVTGLRVLRGLGAQHAASARYTAASGESLRAALRATAASAAYRGVSTALSATFIAAIAFVAGGMALSGEITIGGFVAVVGLAQLIQGPMAALGFFGVDVAQKRGSAKRLVALLTEPFAVADLPGTSAGAGTSTAAGGTTLTVRADGKNGWPAFTARRGEIVGVVASDSVAARKLVDALGFRMPAPRDTLFVDGIDLSDASPDHGRSLVFAAPHNSALFGGTLQHNLAGESGIDERAIHASAVGDVVGGLERGIHTELRAEASALSGGQRQRVLLARALHQPQPILVLHDPTTAVDTLTESMIADGLRRFDDRAIVLVTSSAILLSACDRVFGDSDAGSSLTRTPAADLDRSFSA